MAGNEQDIWTIKDILDWCTNYLERHGDPQPLVSAQWLLSEITGLSRINLYVQHDQPLSLEERALMRSWVQRRAEGEPLQLITGKAPFRYLNLQVEKGVLIPRPETEVLVSECIQACNLVAPVDRIVITDEGETIEASEVQGFSIADICTGSGCIACAFASEFPQVNVVATDIDTKALSLAQTNVAELGLSDRVALVPSDLMGALLPDFAETFDLVVSNPPYIPTSLLETLDKEVTAYDPKLALDGGADGLDIFRRLAPEAYIALKSGGIFGVELHEGHLDKALKIAQAAGFTSCEIKQDLAGRDRILLAQKP